MQRVQMQRGGAPLSAVDDVDRAFVLATPQALWTLLAGKLREMRRLHGAALDRWRAAHQEVSTGGGSG
jgi:hypothetical protein